VPDFWVVDIKARRITVHRNPAGDACTDVTDRSPLDTLDIKALPGSAMPAAEVFPYVVLAVIRRWCVPGSAKASSRMSTPKRLNRVATLQVDRRKLPWDRGACLSDNPR
jgi:hypothetical protein